MAKSLRGGPCEVPLCTLRIVRGRDEGGKFFEARQSQSSSDLAELCWRYR